MKNTYEYQVRAQCPVNPSDVDLYDFVIESQTIIDGGQQDVFPYPVKRRFINTRRKD